MTAYFRLCNTIKTLKNAVIVIYILVQNTKMSHNMSTSQNWAQFNKEHPPMTGILILTFERQVGQGVFLIELRPILACGHIMRRFGLLYQNIYNYYSIFLGS